MILKIIFPVWLLLLVAIQGIIVDEPDSINLILNERRVAKQAETNVTDSPSSELAALGAAIISIISISAAVVTLYAFIETHFVPRPHPEVETLRIVKHLEKLLRAHEESQYKPTEDTISRALYDMTILDVGTNVSDDQRLIWLERARRIDADVILMMEGMLGKPVAGIDLMDNMKEHLDCHAIQMTERVKKYNDLVAGGAIAFNHFANLGRMSQGELVRRTSAFNDRNDLILQRNEELVEECFRKQLEDIGADNADDDGDGEEEEVNTETIAARAASRMSLLYPLPTRWVVAAYHDEQQSLLSRASPKPAKPKLSANYNIHIVNGFHVALFPFLDGTMPRSFNGQNVDAFCNRPIRGTGDMPQCDVGSTDGEFVYDELRRLGIVPNNLDLLVVPSRARLSVRSVPVGGLPPFFAKHYPDFDIIVF